MNKFSPLIEVNNDNLYIPEVRIWSLEKYKLVGTYCDIFTSGMRNKWDQLIYIDLFAGAGFAKIIESGKIYKNAALVAMSIPYPFSKYIICEQDPQRFAALKIRIERDFSHLNYELILGDSNENIQNVLKAIPPFKKGNTLLPFCFVDPYSLNLNFTTIQTLGRGLMDFLILQALHMDANRNFDLYIKEENLTISNYLGIIKWRDEFNKLEVVHRKNFVKFLADQYQQQMHTLGYQKNKHMHHIRSNDKNLPLYYLSFYSKNPRGIDFLKGSRSVKSTNIITFVIMATSSIEWTELTWNPVTGCTKISPGCKFCYAETMTRRLTAMGVEKYKDGFKIRIHPDTLNIPFTWKKSKVVFVNSMSDLFHPDVPIEFIKAVFAVMNSTPQHVYQVLTKRSERLLEVSKDLNWTSNIWMGVSVENEDYSYRIKDLSKTSAKIKFLSIEPLIGPLKTLPLAKIDWVIVGGESGHKARPLEKEWIEYIRRKCNAKNVAFFFKQWGKPKFNANQGDPTIDSKHPKHAKGGCELDGKIYRELPVNAA